jgi:hypothetical protein
MKRTAVFQISGKEKIPKLLFVEFSGQRSPLGFEQRINERRGSNVVIKFLGMEDELSPDVLGLFTITFRANTLESAQSFALHGAWENRS